MSRRSPMEQLIEILTGQRDCYAALLRLGEQKHQAILADDLNAIEQTVEQEQALISTLGRMERDRMALADGIAAQLQIPVDQLGVSSLLRRVDHKTRQTLITLRDEMANVLERTEELSRINGELLEKALRKVNRSMQLLGVSAPQQPTYSPQTQQPAKQNDLARANVLDRRI